MERAGVDSFVRRTATILPSSTSASEMRNPDQSVGCEDVSPAEDDSLHKCLSDLALLDMASKARLLQSLSSYLSCVASTMFASTEDFSLSAWVGTSKVRLRNVEVMALHKLLVRELHNHTELLATPHSTSYIFSVAEGDESDEILSRTLHLKVVSETVRCCIRILPLLDCFDTSLSLSGAALLDGLMQQLCSPRILFDVLNRLSNGSRSNEQQSCPTNSSCAAAQGCMSRSELFASKEVPIVFSSPSDSVDVFYSNSELERESQRRMDVFLALLEVYMDELLLSPDLGARFLTFQDEAHLLFKQEHLMSSSCRHAEAALEAAFVHGLLSCLSKQQMHGTRTNASDESLVCNLSLPASLLLLETLAEENVPTIYMTHVVQLVARVLGSSTSQGDDLVVGITSAVTPEDSRCWSGGVDWSYCLNRVSAKRDPMGCVLKPECLPSITTIHFASSIFEQAMLLYRRLSTSTHLSTGLGNDVPSVCESANNFFSRFCVSKYRPLVDMFCNKSELDTGKSFAPQMIEVDEAMFHTGFTDDIASCSNIYLQVMKTCACHDRQADEVGICKNSSNYEKGDEEGDSSLVSAVLQLGISSLGCITREIGNMLRLSSDSLLQLPSEHPKSTATHEDDADRVFAFISLYLSSFLPCASQARAQHQDCHLERNSDRHFVTDVVSCGQRSLISSVGTAILFFTDVFCVKVQTGASEDLLEDYFHVLESLIALLLVVDGSKSLSSSLEKKHSTHSQPSVSHDETKVPVDNYFSIEKIDRDNSSFSCLGAMVHLLQNMLQELLSQQRLLPDFFLDFVLEQISRGDGLNVVSMAFGGSFKQCLEGRHSHQSVMVNVGSIQSKGLVNQILQLALQKPNIKSSFSTLLGYVTDILADLLPITATSLHGFSESLSCYEHIAYTFTLACQFAVSEQFMVFRNGHECRSWFLSRMSEGIERLFTEGSAVAQLMSNWTSSKTVPGRSSYSKVIAPGSSCSSEPENMWDASYSEEGQLQFCSSFLVQIDLLRSAVGAMRSATDRFLIPELEFSSLFTKARTFLEAFSRLRMMVDKPVRLWRFHIFLQEQLSLHRCDELNSVEEDRSMDKQKVNSKTDFTALKDNCGPERCDTSGDDGRTQAENFRSPVRSPVSSGRGPSYVEGASEHRTADDGAVDLDGERSTVGDELLLGTMGLSGDANNLHCQHIHSEFQQKDLQAGDGPTLTGRTDNDDASEDPLVNKRMTGLLPGTMGLSGEANNLDCSHIHSEFQEKDPEVRDGPTFTSRIDNDEASYVPLVSKRITRSAALSMSQNSGGGAHIAAAEVVVDSLEPTESKKRLRCSSTTLAIVKRLTQVRQPPCKKGRRGIQGSTERYAEGLDLLPRVPVQQDNLCLDRQLERHWESGAHHGAVDSAVMSNPYIESVSGKVSCQESFDDLNDFIVCKKGRNYSEWLKKRQTVRRRLHTRNLFKRLQEKRDLLLLLDICE